MKNKAFSLIEIVQTIVLLGIIAGLAISFFKNFRPNDKLFFSTQTLIEQAVQQAKRDMCNDQRPVVVGGPGGGGVVWLCDPNYCSTVLAGSTYNKSTGYCEMAIAAGDECAAGSTSRDTNYDGVADTCFAILTGRGGNECIPMREVLCQTPDYIRFNARFTDSRFGGVAETQYTTISYTTSVGEHDKFAEVPILCYYLQKTLNHKTQNTDAHDPYAADDANKDTDLIRTCNAGNDWQTAFTNATTLNNENATGIPHSIANPQNDHYSMLLPNGVRLYNLGYVMPSGGTQKIFVKYDGLDDIDSSVLSTAGDSVSNIKNSTVWCLKVTDAGVVSRCDIGD